MMKKFPRIFLAGEMIDWSAPTGGFLIQGCVSQGHFVGNQMAGYLDLLKVKRRDENQAKNG